MSENTVRTYRFIILLYNKSGSVNGQSTGEVRAYDANDAYWQVYNQEAQHNHPSSFRVRIEPVE